MSDPLSDHGEFVLRHTRPFEWNEWQEERTKAFYEDFVQMSRGSTANRADIFEIMNESEELDFGNLEIWTQQECEMNSTKEKMKMMHVEVLRIWCDEDGWLQWNALSPERREGLIACALVDVEDMNEVNLRGRRQLCPELVIKDLAMDPTKLLNLLLRCTATTNGRIALPSHPFIDRFLGLPKTLAWAYKNMGPSMYAQSILVTRAWYLTLFLVAAVLRLVKRPLSSSFNNRRSPQSHCFNPTILQCASSNDCTGCSSLTAPKPPSSLNIQSHSSSGVIR
jgi:hypothetical protein